MDALSCQNITFPSPSRATRAVAIVSAAWNKCYMVVLRNTCWGRIAHAMTPLFLKTMGLWLDPKHFNWINWLPDPLKFCHVSVDILDITHYNKSIWYVFATGGIGDILTNLWYIHWYIDMHCMHCPVKTLHFRLSPEQWPSWVQPRK